MIIINIMTVTIMPIVNHTQIAYREATFTGTSSE